jgi:hypothetical protein
MRHVTAAAIAVTLALAVAAQSDEPFLKIPPQEEVLNTLRHDHPRVMLYQNSFDKVRTAISADPLLAGWHKDLIASADAILEEPPSEYVLPDGVRLLSVSRRVRDRTMALGYAYHMTGDVKYKDRAWAELQAAAAFKDWHPVHFLDTAEMTCAFGIGYDWFYNAWTPEQRETIRAALMKHGLGPALRCYRGEAKYRSWVRSTYNWNQVCNGGIGVGAIAIADEEPELAAEILHQGMLSLPRAMRRFAPDGGWAEGPGYWEYATSYNVMHLAALNTALGTDFGLSRFPGFERAGEFPIYMTGGVDMYFNFADAKPVAVRPPQMFWLAKRFNRPDYAEFERRAGGTSVLGVIWAAELGWVKPGPAQPLDRYYTGIDVVTMRSAWDDPDQIYVGFKGGSNRASHCHLDLGSFVMDALGERWAWDLGKDNYNIPGYFGDKRWTYYRLRPEGHNTILFNPSEQPGQNRDAVAKITLFHTGPERVAAAADLTPAYGQYVQKAVRGIALLDGRSRVLIRDEVSPKAGDLEMWWFMHTGAEIEVMADDPSRATLRIGDKRVEARILSPANARFMVMDARPLPTSPNPKEQDPNDGYRKLAIRLTLQGDTTLVVLLTPLRPGARPSPAPALVPLSQW